MDNAQYGAMLEGPLIIMIPNRPHCCPLPQGQGLHWGTHPPACELEHIFSVFPNPRAVKPSWGALYDPKIDLQKKRPMRTSKSGAPCANMQVAVRGFLACVAVPDHLRPSFTPRACSFANQRLLWCIRGSNSVWCEFVYRHGSCLLTKRGSEQHRHRPERTKISNRLSVQHADLGVPNGPFQGLSEYTPHAPPFGTHRGQKQGKNDGDHRKPTELAQNILSPRDILGASWILVDA